MCLEYDGRAGMHRERKRERERERERARAIKRPDAASATLLTFVRAAAPATVKNSQQYYI
jgi:hypothetical protein